MNKDWDQYFNIAGQYEGGKAFETKELTYERAKYLHDDLLKHLRNRKGNDHGQHGTLQGYYKNLKI